MSEGNADGWQGPYPERPFKKRPEFKPSDYPIPVVHPPPKDSPKSLLGSVALDYPAVVWRFEPFTVGNIKLIGEVEWIGPNGNKVRAEAGRTICFLEDNETVVFVMRQIGEALYANREKWEILNNAAGR